ncbi:MAG: cyclic nucleotide-binding domain-containing protein [Fimbriimonadaceae bacterium]|nr:cyclic nucleotide-binding domain-containing protein [Fimbriimonadaceae bacterium]
MLDLDAFKKTYLTVGLTDEQIQAIADLATLRRFSPQETLIRMGDQSSDLYVILNGRLAVLTPDGDKISEVGPGSLLGEIALIDARPRTANVVCVGLVDAAVIPAQALRSLLSKNRDWGFVVLSNLARVLAGRLRVANEKIEELYDKNSDTWDNAL